MDKKNKSQKDDEEPEDDEENEETEELDDEDDENGDATEKKGGSSKSEGRTYTQEQVDAAVSRRLARAKRKMRSELRGEIEDEIRESGNETDVQKRLDTALDRIKELEELEELADLAEERYEQELESLPEHIRDLAPDDDASILVKERWLVQKGRPAAQKFLADKSGSNDDTDDKDRTGERKRKPARRGNNPKDPPADNEDKRTTVEKLRDEARRSGQYRRIV